LNPETDPADVVIRPMEVDDIAAVHSIDTRSFSLPWTERSYQFEILFNKTSHAWVAEVGNADGERQVAAMIVVWLVVDEAHLGTIATGPEFRRRGIGRKLILHALRELWPLGARKAYLEVRISNSAAQQLYKSLGFQEGSVRRRYYHDNKEDALLMTLAEDSFQNLLAAP